MFKIIIQLAVCLSSAISWADQPCVLQPTKAKKIIKYARNCNKVGELIKFFPCEGVKEESVNNNDYTLIKSRNACLSFSFEEQKKYLDALSVAFQNNPDYVYKVIAEIPNLSDKDEDKKTKLLTEIKKVVKNTSLAPGLRFSVKLYLAGDSNRAIAESDRKIFYEKILNLDPNVVYPVGIIKENKK